MNARGRQGRAANDAGFTLIEIVVALGILGVSLFVLLQTHYGSLSLISTAQEESIFDVILTEALNRAEFEVLSGETSGGGEFGEDLSGYSYSYSATPRKSNETPGLIDVTVTITGPNETQDIQFFIYDGQLYEVR